LFSVVLVVILAFIEGKVGLPKQIGPILIRESYYAVDIVDNCVTGLKRQPRTVEASGKVDGDLVIQFSSW
jgi:hypothetical protein